jgi:hypothetical protein
MLVTQGHRQAIDERHIAMLANTDGPGDCRGDEIRIQDRRESNEPNPIRKTVGHMCGGRKGEAGLATTAWSGQREQAHIIAAQKSSHSD